MITVTEQVKKVQTRVEENGDNVYMRFYCPTCGATVIICEADKVAETEKPQRCGNCKTELVY